MIIDNQIQVVHHAAIGKIKESLSAKAKEQVDFSNDKLILDQQILDALNEDGKQKLDTIQQQAKENVLNAYDEVLAWMAKEHLTQPQSEEIISKAKERLQQKLEITKSKLFSDLQATINPDKKGELEQALQRSELCQSLDKTSKQLGEALVGFGPSAINTYKAKLSLNNEQLKKKKTDAHLIANVFDPESFSPDPKTPIDYDYKIDIDKLRAHIKHNLANLKPGEKIHIDVEIPPDRADILKKVAETGFQYRISLVALLILFFIQLKMVNKDDETRVASAVKKIIEEDHIPLRAEDITFSIKSRGNDGKLQTVLEPRPLDPAVAAWKFNKPLQNLENALRSDAASKKQMDELEENKLQSNCRQEASVDLNDNVRQSPSLVY